MECLAYTFLARETAFSAAVGSLTCNSTRTSVYNVMKKVFIKRLHLAWARSAAHKNNTIDSYTETRAQWNPANYVNKDTTTRHSTSFSSIPYKHIHAHARARAHTHTHTHIHTHTHTHARTHARTHAQTHTREGAHARTEQQQQQQNTRKHTCTRASHTEIYSVLRGDKMGLEGRFKWCYRRRVSERVLHGRLFQTNDAW